MKHIVLLVFTLFTVTISFAECDDDGIFCLSKSYIINKNGLIVLEFYGLSQSLVADINYKYPIYLKSSKDKIKLNVIEVLKGEMLVTQVVLKAKRTLKPNEVYSLEIDSLPQKIQKPGRYNFEKDIWDKLIFKANNYIDNENPVLKIEPSEYKKKLIYYGCGPECGVYFNLLGHDKSEIYARTTVKNVSTGLTTTYILSIENEKVYVGHEMCYGPFYFRNGDNFEVIFQLFDQSGNTSNFTKSISFTKPTISTDDEFEFTD